MTSQLSFLDVMCPMHAVLAADGRIVHVGPTLRKLHSSSDLVGTGFLDSFDVTRPQNITRAGQLLSLCGKTLHLKRRHAPHVGLKGVIVPHPTIEGGMILNLSFGISAAEAVRRFALNNSDFAPTDLTVEMLYLLEAKSVVMAASRRLNERLLEARTQAEKQAETDALTGVENRRGLERFVARLIARQAAFALLHVDLDHFKAVNDTLGHDAGDMVLQQAAQIMRDELRDGDLVARVGGDEFILLIEGDMQTDAVGAIGSRVITRISALTVTEDHQLSVGCSIGAVLSRHVDPPVMQDLLKAADLALYASKGAGRGRFTMFDPMSHGALPAQQVLDDRGLIAKPAR